ncbi:MAG: winged helix-turn-helix domain-containing protein [Actinomycetia bacterium]|nr:winged helix-turn-helix domain-containing protein [Actinomycetes bacterium]
MHSHDKADQTMVSDDRKPWTFLTNHTRVLVVISDSPTARLRDIAETIGITERAAQRIVADLEEAGYLSHEKIGRRNVYQIEQGTHLRHELEQNNQLRSLLDLIRPNQVGR